MTWRIMSKVDVLVWTESTASLNRVGTTSMEVGVQVSFESLQQNYDAVVMSGGAEEARRLDIPGAEMAGVRLAMEFLTQQNKRNAGDDELRAAPRGTISAKGKHVIVIGGGDTGSDCVGTSNRQGAASVTQIEIMPKPPVKEDKAMNWPNWPMKLRTSSSHEEGCKRDWAVLTKRVVGTNGTVEGLECVRVDWVDGKPGLVEQAEVTLDGRGNVQADTENYETSRDGVFACGDMRRGQSLVVWAIREGRQCARAVDLYLTGRTELPR